MRILWLAALASFVMMGRPFSQDRVGATRDHGTLVPTHQIVRPAGNVLEYGGRPVDLVLSPNGKTLYAKDNRGLVVVTLADWKIKQELAFPSGGGSMHGIAVSSDGTRIYATNSDSLLLEAKSDSNGKLSWSRRITLPRPKIGGESYPCGIALSRDGKRAYVCLSRNNSLAIVDLEAGKVLSEIPVGIAPFDVILTLDETTACVSNWGGQLPKAGEKTAKSAGTETLVDERGVGKSGTVSFVNLTMEKETGKVETGLHPSDLELSEDGRTLYTANANSDTVSVIDVAARVVTDTLSVRPDNNLPFGSAPNALTLDAESKTLYVANGGNNAVAVIDLVKKKEVVGFIPTAWYPGGIVSDANTLYIANIKGLGSRTRKEPKGYNSYDYTGVLQRVAKPTVHELPRYTKQVLADARIPQILRTREKAQSNIKPVPVPKRVGEPSVFEHIVYIIKENRTYDQVFGDLKQGNGDPKLCIFGYSVTPNHHALAEQFVLLDNFYCNGVLSADGHSWATEGNVTDHLEKAFGGFTRSYTFGDDPLTYSSSGFLWDNVLAKGLSFRNYGEMNYSEPVPTVNFSAVYKDYTATTGKVTFTQSIGIDRLRQYSCREYPGWNMQIPDVLRAGVFLKELKQFEQNGGFPNLSIVYLPQDHTSGTSPGMPTPRAHMADNDTALGRVVEGISRSKFWAKTCIFVIEDDPQDGFDHVDGHRSIGLVISPYTKRGKTVSKFYNQTSVLHTMQRMLGLPALNQMDSLAPLMTDCFQTKPDFRPYACLPSTIPLDELNPPVSALQGKVKALAQQSRTLNFKQVDAANEDMLNRILWHNRKGVNAPYPVHFAGTHGKGLKSRKLHLSSEPD